MAQYLQLIKNTTENSLLATTGIPFPKGKLPQGSIPGFTLVNSNGDIVNRFAKPVLLWPDGTVMALKVQFTHTGPNANYSWHIGDMANTNLAEKPIQEIPSSHRERAGYPEPVAFVMNSPEYIISTRIFPPTVPADDNIFDKSYFLTKFSFNIADPDTGITFGPNALAQDWLLDTTSTIYKQAIRNMNIEYYREAYLNYKFHMAHFITVAATDTGGWKGPGARNGADGKMVYVEPQKFHLALTGDDTYRPPTNEIATDVYSLATQSATILFSGANRTSYRGYPIVHAYGFLLPYTERGATYTERHAGIGLISLLNAYQINRNPDILGYINTAVDNICNHNFDTNNVWGGYYAGYNKHSWYQHEQNQAAWAGMGEATPDSHTLVLRDTIGDPDILATGGEISIPMKFKVAAKAYDDNEGMLDTNGKPIPPKWIFSVTGGLADRVFSNIPAYINGEFIGRPWVLQVGNTTKFEIRGKPAAIDLTSYEVGDEVSINWVRLRFNSVTDNGNSTWTLAMDEPVNDVILGKRVVITRGSSYPPTDAGFSPWMSSILMDGLWQYYHWTDDTTRKDTVAKVLLGFARANICFGIDGTSTSARVINAIVTAFSDWPTEEGVTVTAGQPDYEYAKMAPTPRYAAAWWMGTKEATREAIINMSESGYQQQHLPELIFQMAVGMYFEKDEAKREAMRIVGEESFLWFDEYVNTIKRGAIRSFPWQLRSDPYGTWRWVLEQLAGGTAEPTDPVEPDLPPEDPSDPKDPPVTDPEDPEDPTDPELPTDPEQPVPATPYRDIDYIAEDSGYYRVYEYIDNVRVDTPISQHLTERKALDVAADYLRKMPTGDFRVTHDGYTVRVVWADAD